jgi:hypothetical protein
MQNASNYISYTNFRLTSVLTKTFANCIPNTYTRDAVPFDIFSEQYINFNYHNHSFS